MYSSNNSPNTPTFSPRTAAEPARMGCGGEGALHLRILASFARGVRACLRRFRNHRKRLRIELVQRIAGTATISPVISVPKRVRHRQRRPRFLASQTRRPLCRAEHAFSGLPGSRVASRAHARHDGDDDGRRRARSRLAARVGNMVVGGKERVPASCLFSRDTASVVARGGGEIRNLP